ncbi:MAG: DUF1385 domain-containing protein, partial [Armatimonadia bacterium]|nr:DUF1385 domain-containing protein [Armatimonadia bacterium]
MGFGAAGTIRREIGFWEAMAEASPNVTEHQEDEGREELSPSQVAELSGAREETPIYGGQALMEGVMMRSPRFVAAAVRREDGEIIIKREPLKSPGQKPKIMKLPLVRGVFALWDAFSVGLRYLTFSGDVLMAEAQQQESIQFEEDEVTFEDVGERAVTATHVPTGLSVHADREKTREANRKRAERILRGKVVRHREGQEAGGIEEHETAGDDDGGPEQADTGERAEQRADPTPGGNGKPQSLPASTPSSGGGTTLAMYGTMAVAFAIALVVFLWTPHA